MNKTLSLYLKHSCLCILLLFPVIVFGQKTVLDQQISISFKGADLTQILDILTKNHNINFSYNPEILPQRSNLNISFENEAIKNILSEVIQDESLKYEVLENYVIIYKPGSTPNYHEKEPQHINTYAIRGKVLDAMTKNTVPFSHVTLKNKSIGTISNNEGEYILNYSDNEIGDTLLISCIGYKPFEVGLDAIDTANAVFELHPVEINLDEIKVTPTLPYELILNANAIIHENFVDKPAMLKAFFRESVKYNDAYISISEAYLDIYKASYVIEYMNDRIKMLKGRKVQDYSQVEDIDFTVMGGLFYILKLDVVKEKASFIDPYEFNNYNYDIEKIIDYNNRATYVISFKQRPNVSGYFYNGTLYIDVETFAYIGADFYLSPQALKFAAQVLVKKAPLQFEAKPIFAHYRVDYRNYGSKWNLNNARGEIHFEVTNRKTKESSVFSTVSEFLVTARDSVNVRKFKFSEVSKASDVFVEQIDKYDSKFWESFNIIKPDVSLQEAFGKLARNKTVIITNRQNNN